MQNFNIYRGVSSLFDETYPEYILVGIIKSGDNSLVLLYLCDPYHSLSIDPDKNNIVEKPGLWTINNKNWYIELLNLSTVAKEIVGVECSVDYHQMILTLLNKLIWAEKDLYSSMESIILFLNKTINRLELISKLDKELISFCLRYC